MLGRDGQAIQYLDKCREINPSHFFVHYTLAAIYKRQQKYEKAIEMYE